MENPNNQIINQQPNYNMDELMTELRRLQEINKEHEVRQYYIGQLQLLLIESSKYSSKEAKETNQKNQRIPYGIIGGKKIEPGVKVEQLYEMCKSLPKYERPINRWENLSVEILLILTS